MAWKQLFLLLTLVSFAGLAVGAPESVTFHKDIEPGSKITAKAAIVKARSGRCRW